MLLMFSVAVPGFESTTVWLTVVVPAVVAGKVRLAGVNTACGCWFPPVPESATVCGEPVASCATDRLAEKVLAEFGVNVTLIVHFADTARSAPQVLVVANAPPSAPVTAIPEIV